MFAHLEVAGRGSETQRQVGENVNKISRHRSTVDIGDRARPFDQIQFIASNV